jgi:GNAT superfamily N-acetyltransferase
VSNAWKFQENFQPKELADINEYIYTTGSIALSNYKKVIEVDGKVVSFLFGFNEKLPVSPHEFQKISHKMMLLKKIIMIKNMSFFDKFRMIKATFAHEMNKAKLVKHGSSEIFLFVTDPEYQGEGYGQMLFKGFVANCKDTGVETIHIETNTLGASSFYERVHCVHKGDFFSPLHAYTTKGGQACVYTFKIEV